MKLSQFILSIFLFVFSLDAYGKDFILKSADGETTIELGIEKYSDLSIALKDPSAWEQFSDSTEAIPSQRIDRRDPTQMEQLFQTGLLILTGLMAFGTWDTYDINSSLRLTTQFGLVLLFIPFEDHYLYRKCLSGAHQNEEFLVATTASGMTGPLRSMEEVDALCRESGDNDHS